MTAMTVELSEAVTPTAGDDAIPNNARILNDIRCDKILPISSTKSSLIRQRLETWAAANGSNERPHYILPSRRASLLDRLEDASIQESEDR